MHHLPIPTMAIYEGHFVNEQGISNIFCFHYKIRQGVLTRYEGGVATQYSVFGGTPCGTRLNSREQLWLRACWSTAQRISWGESSSSQILSENDQTNTLSAHQSTTQPLALPIHQHAQNMSGERMRAWRKARQQHKYS